MEFQPVARVYPREHRWVSPGLRGLRAYGMTLAPFQGPRLGPMATWEETPLVSGKVLCDSPQVLFIVVSGVMFGRERFEIQSGKNGCGERIGTLADNGGCILAGSCFRN